MHIQRRTDAYTEKIREKKTDIYTYREEGLTIICTKLLLISQTI